MLWSKTFDNEIKEIRYIIRDIRRNWLSHRQETNPNEEYKYEYYSEKSEIEDNFNPCANCGESKGKRKYVSEYTSVNGKDRGRAFSYCDNCGKSVEYDWDNTKALEEESSKKPISQQENVGKISQTQSQSQTSSSEPQKNKPEMSQQTEQKPSGSQTHSQ